MFKMRFESCFDTYYEVEEKKRKQHYAIYFCYAGGKEFVTHRSSQRQATKLAKLLAETYRMGYERGGDW